MPCLKNQGNDNGKATKKKELDSTKPGLSSTFTNLPYNKYYNYKLH